MHLSLFQHLTTQYITQRLLYNIKTCLYYTKSYKFHERGRRRTVSIRYRYIDIAELTGWPKLTIEHASSESTLKYIFMSNLHLVQIQRVSILKLGFSHIFKQSITMRACISVPTILFSLIVS